MTKSLVTVATPPYWWSNTVNKPSRVFSMKMFFCMVVDCRSKSAPGKDLHFARVPSVVTNQGEEVERLSFEQRSHWISAISRSDLTEKILANDRVCSRHFVSGKAAKSWDKYNVNWVRLWTWAIKRMWTEETSNKHHKEDRELMRKKGSKGARREGTQQRNLSWLKRVNRFQIFPLPKNLQSVSIPVHKQRI